MGLGLSNRFSNEFATWERRRRETMKRFQGTCSERQEDMRAILDRNRENIKSKLREAVIIEVLKAFPCVLSAPATRQ